MNYVLHWIGTASLLIYGIASAIKPQWIARFLAHDLPSGRAISEFRVAHGSLVGLSLFALVMNDPLVFQLLGCGCLGAAAVRVLAYLLDRPRVTVDYLAFFVTEIGVGIVLLR
jgi:hypothetical protein